MTESGKGSGGKRRGQSGAAPASPNKAAMKALLTLMGELEAETGASDLDRAQDKVFDAVEAPSRAKRIALAKQALAISPLCADALVLLAQEEKTPEGALSLYQQAVQAGEQAIGADAFDDDVGLFWGVLETRPYMRARHGLAQALWDGGAREEAVAHYEDMLRLNPNDNQGIRYSLLDALLELGRDGAAAELLKRYKDDASAAWAWSRALLAFRQKGDAAPSRKALARAVETNPHVTAYLLGRKALPRALPHFIGIGDDDEAVAYVHDADAAWRAAKGAKGWVEAALPDGSRAPSSSGDRTPAVIGDETPEDRIDDAVLALLLLGLHDEDRAWKGFDWDAMDRLHRKGLISNPASRAKSVMFTAKGLDAARRLHDELFVMGRPTKQP